MAITVELRDAKLMDGFFLSRLTPMYIVLNRSIESPGNEEANPRAPAVPSQGLEWPQCRQPRGCLDNSQLYQMKTTQRDTKHSQ